MKRASLLLLCSVLLMAVHCGRKHSTEKDLSKTDKQFLQDLGLLDASETVDLFQADDLKESGALLTQKRIAYYWLGKDGNDISSAQLSTIDSMKVVPNFRTLTYASYIEVFRSDGLDFKVYMDVDSLRLYRFFDRAQELWNKSR